VVLVGEADAERRNVLFQPGDPLGPGNRHDCDAEASGLAVHPRKCDLRRRHTLAGGDI